ncbi:MAG TPA: hypothetical protein VMD91_04725 [Candidatus Sulfotelmatobacter sp.]|nr:hypothetical protein [Candidatus Sulfotelmatobacter sp.]
MHGDDGDDAVENLRNHVREGRFQRTLALLAAGASALSGLEVAYEHYRGSYGQRIMYTPVVLSAALTGAGVWAFFSRSAARSIFRAVSAVTLADSALGFVFHVRGIARKPGGWRLPITNVIMGPPLFAPLLFGTAAYLGLIASFLRREDAPASSRAATREPLTLEQDVREGRFQQHMLIVAGLSASFSGVEALYSHYKSGFRYRSQWWPVALAPLLAIACAAGVRERRYAVTAVPLLSAVALAVAGLGFFYHVRGVLRRPGGAKYVLYNVMYGPPVFAPLLFGAAGGLGLLASQLRRSER